MHENREISCTSWSTDQDRSAKATNRTADVNVQEKSDCAVVPMNWPNKEGQPSAEVGEGRAQTIGEHRSITHAPDTERETHVPGIARCAASSIRRDSSLVRAVCVNAPVRIRAGGDQRWSSLPRQLTEVAVSEHHPNPLGAPVWQSLPDCQHSVSSRPWEA